jgi:hypothetical protein
MIFVHQENPNLVFETAPISVAINDIFLPPVFGGHLQFLYEGLGILIRTYIIAFVDQENPSLVSEMAPISAAITEIFLLPVFGGHFEFRYERVHILMSDIYQNIC